MTHQTSSAIPSESKSKFYCHYLNVGKDEYIIPRGPEVRTNHSCDPNAGIVDDVFLAAMRDIKKDEKITFDYYTISADDWKMGCRCDAPCCRGVVGNYRDLPERLKAKYDKFTPAWIKALCGAVARSCRSAIAGFRRALFFFLMPSV